MRNTFLYQGPGTKLRHLFLYLIYFILFYSFIQQEFQQLWNKILLDAKILQSITFHSLGLLLKNMIVFLRATLSFITVAFFFYYGPLLSMANVCLRLQDFVTGVHQSVRKVKFFHCVKVFMLTTSVLYTSSAAQSRVWCLIKQLIHHIGATRRKSKLHFI